MKNFFSILFLITTCLIFNNGYAVQQLPEEFCEQLLNQAHEQTEAFNEKTIKVMKIKAVLLKRAREENNADIIRNFSEHFFDALVKAGFTQAEAAEYAFDTTKNN